MTYELRREDFDLSELLDGQYVHLDRKRVVILCEMCALEDYNLTQSLIAKAQKIHTERERLVHLVELAEAIAQPRESDELASRGMLYVDEKHRNSLTALVDVSRFCNFPLTDSQIIDSPFSPLAPLPPIPYDCSDFVCR